VVVGVEGVVWVVGVEGIEGILVEGTLPDGLQELLSLCCCGCSQREGQCTERKASRPLSEGTSSSQRGVAMQSVGVERAQRQSRWQQQDGGARCGRGCEWDSVRGSSSDGVLLSEEHLAECQNAVLEHLPLPNGARVACAVPLVREPAVHLRHRDPTCTNRPTF